MQIDPRPIRADAPMAMSIRPDRNDLVAFDTQSFTTRQPPVLPGHLGICGLVGALVFTVGLLLR